MHRRLRLERAAWALHQTERPVTQLAFEAGYTTHESFTRAFAAAFGASPTEFRARTRKSPTSWGAATASAYEACLELVALYYDDAEVVPAAELSADAGVVVREGTPVPAGLHLVSIPAGTYASTVHEGPYDRLADAWARFMGGWLVSSGRTLASGPSYERYLNTPNDAAPHELRTELFLPLAEA